MHAVYFILLCFSTFFSRFPERESRLPYQAAETCLSSPIVPWCNVDSYVDEEQSTCAPGHSPRGGSVMCQTAAYVVKGGEELLVLQDVISVTPERDGIKMVNLFGEEKIVEGRIKQI